MGYSWVSVFSAGEPGWKNAGYPLWGNEPSGVVEAPKAQALAPGGLPATIGAAEFKKLVAEGMVAVVDVRSESEYAAGHVPGALNIPDGLFYADYPEAIRKLPTDRQVLIHCVTGIRAGGVYNTIVNRGGYDNPKGIQYLQGNFSATKEGVFTID